MNMKSISKPNNRKSKKLMMIGLAFSCTLAAGNASAVFGVGDTVVEVGPSLYNHIMNQINTYSQKIEDAKEYGEQAMRWRNTISHYQQQLAALRAFQDQAMAMGITDKIEERAPAYGMADACPDASGAMSFSSLFSPFSLNMNGNIVEQQQEICQRIVLAQNAKYNEAVKMLKNIKKRSGELDRVSSARDSVGTSQGKLDSNTNDVDAILARVTLDMQYMQASVGAYDEYILGMKEDQGRLATRAMSGGKKSWVGTVVQGATLKGALEVLKTRDR